MKESKIALGTWAWGAGMFGGDTVFGSNTDENNLKPVFEAAMKSGLRKGFWGIWHRPISVKTCSFLPNSPLNWPKFMTTA